MKDNNLETLVKACNLIGADKGLVQGAGGNISLKVNESQMLVKASGAILEEVSQGRGIVKVDYRTAAEKVAEFGSGEVTPASESRFLAAMKNTRIGDSDQWPSMEAGFHAVLEDPIILHTHPVGINLIACMQEGEETLRKVAGDLPVAWVPYKNPGLALAEEMRKRKSETIKIWVLQNHGLIVTGKTFDQVFNGTQEVIQKVVKYFGIRHYEARSTLDAKGDVFVETGEEARTFASRQKSRKLVHLFPDTVVFCANGAVRMSEQGIVYKMGERRAAAANEIMLAHAYLTTEIPRHGRINPLEDKDVKYIQEMEAEKYRKKK